VRKKRPELWKEKSRIYIQTMRPTLDFLAVKQYLINKCNSSVPIPSYLPDLAPCNFGLIPKVTSTLKGTHFLSADEVKLKTEHQPNRVPPADDLQHYFELLKIHMQRFIERRGVYVEGNTN
jgi:hypothetical protein